MSENSRDDDQFDSQQDTRRRSTDKFRFKLPFLSGEISGEKVIYVILAGVIAYGLYLHDEKNDTRWAHVEKHMANQVDSADATNYILTLSAAEREKLNLQKPKRIRQLEGNYDSR